MVSYIVDQRSFNILKLASRLAVGHGVGAPGPFKLAFMINMLAKFGVMRFVTGLLGAGPLIAFSSKLGSMITSGLTRGVPLRWFIGLKTFDPKRQRWQIG
jgi:hypothetical protein